MGCWGKHCRQVLKCWLDDRKTYNIKDFYMSQFIYRYNSSHWLPRFILPTQENGTKIWWSVCSLEIEIITLFTTQLLTASHASIHSLYTSMGSDKKFIVAWKSSKQIVHWILAAFLDLSIFTSQLFSWLQKGHVNRMSSASMFLFFGGGFLFDFLRPIFWQVYNALKIEVIIENKFALLWGEAQLCLPYVCL